MKWQWKKFNELSAQELYEILALRQQVFIVEQNCPYLDCDGLDQESWHLLGREKNALVAYLRILPPGLKYPEPSLGRVVTAASVRGTGMGRTQTAEAIKKIEELWGKVPVRISAQAYLEKFYASFGFVRAGENYLEDDIPHAEMLRP
ncbi:MAG: GNAT family N-acetyltransferase [Bacteriovoracia bacterium]